MKASKNIWQKLVFSTIRGGVLMAGILVLICMPQTVITANADNYSNPGEQYQVACLISAEYWPEDRKAAMTKRTDIPADTVDTDAKVDERRPEEIEMNAKVITGT